MSWTLLLALVLVLGLSCLLRLVRQAELARMAARLAERELAVREGSATPQLQHPVVDLSRCLGCATCVAVCPEQGVLDLVHGQAMVVDGGRCAGVSACERECPVGAITVTLSDLDRRRDVPVLGASLEAHGVPGLYLAGEVTAHALIRTAVEHGTRVAREVSERRGTRAGGPADTAGASVGPAARSPDAERVHDLCIVGAGPAGLACALEARRLGLDALLLEQEEVPGGAVARYPRKKLVLTQPVDLPLHGRLSRRSYEKEELIALWERLIDEHALPLRCGEQFQGLDRLDGGAAGQGGFVVRTSRGRHRARQVCLALGRRGTRNRLGVPGEVLPKVAYDLLDAQGHQGRRVLVVGGGDSAVETALALAEQPGNTVTLSYRRGAFSRLRGRNAERLGQALAAGRLVTLLHSTLTAIRPEAVELRVDGAQGGRTLELANDEVFVMAGGQPPFPLLAAAGVSFDPALRPRVEAPVEQGSGLTRALLVAFGLALLTLLWAAWHADYYLLPRELRPTSDKHLLLRSSEGLGLLLGGLATLLIGVNLLYLVRRALPMAARLGSLRAWMSSHVTTGILALLCTLLHAGMQPRDTVGGHAFWALALLLVTGAVGRYFYAWVPRAANGRELELSEVRLRLGLMDEAWDQGQRRFREEARLRVLALAGETQWRSGFFARLLALAGVQRRLRAALTDLRRLGREQGVPRERIDETLQLARQAHRAALMASHLEDLRALLGTWRFLHRWLALLMLLLAGLHVVMALMYGSFEFDGGLT